MSYRPNHFEHRRDSGRFVEAPGHDPRYAAHPQPAAAQHQHPSHHQPRPAHPVPRHPKAAAYTLSHSGRQVRLGPVAFWVVVGSLVIMAGWSVATGTYFAFHDDVLKRLIARQAEMQFAYEDRIAELRSQIDRTTSRQLLDQEQFESKLGQLLSRQATLEQRASALNGIGDPATTGSIRQPARSVPADTSRTGTPKPSPINDTVIFTPPPDREARLESRPLPIENRSTDRRMKGGIEGTLARLSDSLDRISNQQVATLNAVEENYDSKVKRMRGVLTDLGIDAGKIPASNNLTTGSVGGPFVPVKPDASSFDRQVYRINVARQQVDKLTRTLTTVPVRKPVFGEIDMSSPFGMRMDPFMKGPAIHTGVDMRGDAGDPVRATATGTVTVAGWSGGYGKMVEIDHGNGLATRYGHMSAIDVTVGQTVRIGQIVGRIGSTGRSTGPHLHYETRVDGEAVDPQKFLRAGMRLGTLVN